MIKNILTPTIAVALSLVLFFLAGCGSVSKSSRFYVLSPMASMETEKNMDSSEMQDITIGISQVFLPKYLKKSQIVTRTGNNELHLAEFDRWAGKIEEDIGRVIAENLTSLLSTDKVLSFPAMEAVKLDYNIKLDISRFDGSLGDQIELIVLWVIFDDARNNIYGVKATHIIEPIQGRGYVDMVAAQSRALAVFSQEIAAVIGQYRTRKKN